MEGMGRNKREEWKKTEWRMCERREEEYETKSRSDRGMRVSVRKRKSKEENGEGKKKCNLKEDQK